MAKRLAHVAGFPLPDGRSLDLEVNRGEIIRLVGPNGSGKTSLLRALAGLDGALRPRWVQTTDCGIAMQTAMDSLIGLTVAGEAGLRHQTMPQDLADWSDRDVATLSAGEARRVAVAVARQSGPLLLLDEPSEGLDAAARRRLTETLHSIRQSGAVVVADHGDHWADVADRTLTLGTVNEGAFTPFQASPTQDALVVPAQDIMVGGRPLRTPELSLGAGFHVLVGPNGCGKTQTLLYVLQSTDVSLRMLPAHARDVLWEDTVAGCLDGVDDDIRRALVPDDLDRRHPWSLSGGEQQRIALAKVLGHPSQVYLLDEPEAHLDGSGRDALHLVLQRRIDDGSCVLAATHDQSLVAAGATVTSMEARS